MAVSETGRNLLKQAIGALVDPVLTEDDIDLLIAQSTTTDTLGQPVFSLEAAIAAGCELKAVRCSDRVQFSEEGASFQPQQTREFWEARAKEFRRRWAGTIGAMLAPPYEVRP